MKILIIHRFPAYYRSARRVYGSSRSDSAHTSAEETSEQVEISTGSPHAILRDHVQSGCEIYPQASAGRTENLCLAQDVMNTINGEPVFLSLLAVTENDNAIDRIGSRFQREDKAKLLVEYH
ncbi:hypothetical protein TNCV_4910871 [Trichonephila clavipes]|nr:hypothetical protein TNCV_4910871 [Trichonephila clavipes]